MNQNLNLKKCLRAAFMAAVDVEDQNELAHGLLFTINHLRWSK
jgi:hypothetical protein